MSNDFTNEKSSAAQLTAAFAAKLDAVNAAMAGTSTSIPTGTLAQRPTAPPDFTFYGVTDLEQLQVYVGGSWYALTGTSGATAPGPALNLTGTASSANSVNLTWNNPASGNGPFVFAVNYRITGTSGWTDFTNTQSTSASVSGLQANTQYDFEIVTTGQVAPPSTSAVITVQTNAVAPSAPTGVVVTASTSTTLAASWTASANGTSPIAYQATATNGTTSIVSPSLSGTAYTFTGLSPNTTYDITVTAKNGAGTATSSPAVQATTAAAAGSAPVAPTNLTATNIVSDGFTLGWSVSGQASGVSYQPEWAAVSGAVSGVVREPYNQPGSAQSVWNTTVGSGAVLSLTTDADQIALTSKSCTVNYGSTSGIRVWTGQSSDPVTTISSPTVAPAATRSWFNNPGGDGTFWVSPFETSANFITSGSLITTLRNGTFSTPTGHLHVPPDYAAPWYVGTSSDPLVTVTDGTKTIQVHIPVGAQTEQPFDLGSDSSIGGCDTTQPYLVWSISAAKIYDSSGTEIYSISGPGCTIRGGYGFQIDDGSGQMMMDIITGQPGTNNSFGGINEYDMQQALADANYVAQHMLAYSLDPSQCSGQGPIWPLKVIDTSFPNTGGIPQGCTVGIPANTPYPSNKVGNRAFKFLWDIMMQYGAFYYNVGGTGCFQLFAYPLSSATTTFANDLANEMNDLVANLCLLNYNSGTAGAQYSLDTQKGKLPGQASNPAFPPPPPLDLSPTAGANVSPSSFGAWYPSGYNVTPQNTPPGTATLMQRDNGLTANVHCPSNATIGGPDNGITLFDMTQPSRIWSGVGCTYNNGTNVSGGITCTHLETDLTCGSMEDATTGNFGYDAGIGLIRNYDLAQGKIEHALRWLADPSLMSGTPTAWDQGIAWPDTHADYNRPGYTGSIQPGATIVIPASVNLASLGLTQGGLILATAIQQFGAIWRGTATGGVTFSAEANIDPQYVTLLQQMQQDAPKILPLLRLLRNQGPTSKNGGGTPLFPLPVPLDVAVCPGSTGGGSGGAPTTFQPIGQPTTGTSASITGLQPSTTYAFEVKATNNVGSAVSNSIYVTTAVSGTTGGGGGTPTTTTWNSTAFGGPMTFSANKLTAFSGGSTTANSTPQGCISTTGKTTGMFWFEVTAQSITTDFAVGIANTAFVLTNSAGLGSDANGIGYYPVSPSQGIYYSGQGLSYGNGETDSSGATFTIVVDFDGEQFWATSPAMRATVGAGAWNSSLTADPATKAGGISFAGMTGTKYACFNVLEGGAAAVLNMGGSPPSITIPAGVSPWDGSSGGGTSTGLPTMTGPASETVSTNSTVNVQGISVSDSSATGTCSISMACSKGTLTATVGGSPVNGSGTASISYSNTLANCQTAASNLVYTAGSTSGSDNIGVTFTDNLGQSVTIHIPVTIAVSTSPQMLPAGPLSTLGAQIVDQNGNPVRICAVGWAWYSGPGAGPDNLDSLSYKTMLSTLVGAGINCVRIGVAMASVNRDDPFPSGSIDYTLNPDLQGLNFNETLVAVMNYGRSIGLRFIIDWHNQEGTNNVNYGAQPPNGLWYDVGGASDGTDGGGNTGTISQQTYIDLNTKLATMFKGNDALIGIDMLNEPGFGRNPGSTWGGYTSNSGEVGVVGSNRDLRAAYEAGGNAALAANPDLLIICEGIQDYTNPGTTNFAPEGAVQAAQQWPVALNVANKLVYSGHIYPSEVSGASPDNGAGWITRMNTEWGWLYVNNQGPPYWVGESGDNMRTTDGQTYATSLISYLNGNDASSGGPSFSGNQQGVSWDWYSLQVVQTGSVPGFGVLSAGGGGMDQAQQQYLSQMLYVPSGNSSAPPLIQAPLSGTVTTGTWQYFDLTFSGMTHGYMHCAFLLPHGYSAANTYPVLVYEHENSEGDSWYTNPTTDPTQNTIVNQDVIDGTFNTVAFRTDYPCIVIVPFCDQTSDPSGQTSNFGGYNDGAGFTDPNEQAVVALVQHFWANYSCYQPKTYITGDSLGGIGSIAAILDCNRVNGPYGKVFTAALPYAGVIELRTPNPATDTATLTRMANVPYLCLSGSGDTTSNVADYNEPVYRYYAGSSSYPLPPGAEGGSIAGAQAGSSKFYYCEDPTLGHDVWSGNPTGHNYRLLPDGKPFYDWLFSQEVA